METNMKLSIKHVANIRGGQDGAIYGDYLFRFDTNGAGTVTDVSQLKSSTGSDVIDTPLISRFMLDKADLITPHSNAVVFGNEFYADGDEFPLLYSNIYNNYARAENKLCGVCCVYRLQRDGADFSSTLVQLIEIGFTDDRDYWRSAGEANDVRPYGNFVIDSEKGVYYAFVMRDSERTTRYFAFDLPKVSDGETDENFGVKRVTLKTEDIKDYFDTPYHNYIQGACVHDGKIYSVEGFDEKIHPALRIIDTKLRKQIFHYDFCEAGIAAEAELIDFYDGKCYYGDAHRRLFEIELKETDQQTS